MKKYVFTCGIWAFPTIVIIFLAAHKTQEAKAPPVAKAPLSVQENASSPQQQKAQLPPVIKSPSYLGEVAFPHQQHIEEFGLECETCHHETNAAALKFPHEDYFDDFWIDCKICHHENGSATLAAQTCSNCHHALPTDIADETLSSKVVIHKNCWECHAAGKGVEASKNCKFCHTGPRMKF
jgi:hypothetical protein